VAAELVQLVVDFTAFAVAFAVVLMVA